MLEACLGGLRVALSGMATDVLREFGAAEMYTLTLEPGYEVARGKLDADELVSIADAIDIFKQGVEALEKSRCKMQVVEHLKVMLGLDEDKYVPLTVKYLNDQHAWFVACHGRTIIMEDEIYDVRLPF